MRKNKHQISRRLFLAQTLTLLAGCQTLQELPVLHFLDKEGQGDHSLFSADGVITEIKTTGDWQFMAIRYRKRTWEAGSLEGRVSPSDNGLLLYNIEFHVPTPCKEYTLDSFENPFAFAFTSKGDACYVVSDIPASAGAIGKGLSVDKIRLSSKKKDSDSHDFHLEDPEWIDAVLSPTGDWLAVQYQTGEWQFRDLTVDPIKEVRFPETYESKSGEHPIKVSRVLAISPDGALAAVLMCPSSENGGGRNQVITIWDLSTARRIPVDKAKKLPLEALFVSEFHVRDNAAGRVCAFSPDGKMFAARNKQKYVGIWQTANGKILAEFGEHLQPITALQFSPNNTKLVVGTGGNTGRLILWDVRKGQLLRTYNDPEKKSRKITAIQISPDGSLVYFGNDRGNVNQWEYQSKPGVKKS